MVSTARINEDDPRSLGLLGPDEVFKVAVVTEDSTFTFEYFKGNLAEDNKGTLTIWSVVDRVWHRVATIAPGWWAYFEVVPQGNGGVPADYAEEKAEIVSPDEPPQDLDDLTEEPKSFEEERREVLSGLNRGVYPEVGGVTGPRKLKDIWEGKGDPSDEGPEADEDAWPQNGSREEIDRWVAEQARRDEETAQRLRAEADAERDDNLTLPAHLA